MPVYNWGLLPDCLFSSVKSGSTHSRKMHVEKNGHNGSLKDNCLKLAFGKLPEISVQAKLPTVPNWSIVVSELAALCRPCCNFNLCIFFVPKKSFRAEKSYAESSSSLAHEMDVVTLSSFMRGVASNSCYSHTAVVISLLERPKGHNNINIIYYNSHHLILCWANIQTQMKWIMQ